MANEGCNLANVSKTFIAIEKLESDRGLTY
jgi:hypothetical protein